MMREAIEAYLKAVEREYKTGIAREHAYRPALEALLEAAEAGVNAVNDPKQSAIGAPDFVVLRGETPIGIVEAKDIGTRMDPVEDSDQIQRYHALRNVILTDYLEFRWYVDGEKRDTVRIASVDGRIRRESEQYDALAGLLGSFMQVIVPTIRTAQELAGRMANLAHLIRDLIYNDLESDDPHPTLAGQRDAFQKTLLPEIDNAQFADMYAQTIVYGLFAARVNYQGDPATFSRRGAGEDIPRTNPFLRKLFINLGLDLGERVTFLVDALAELLAHTDTDEILKDFGRATRQQDPMVHFYETFLAAYDPALREKRGVYYTPEPVVSYIVRSVDHILRERFGRADGLGDTETMILDPAAGTATFLYFVIQHIYESMFTGQAGMWDSYVGSHLLKRIFGFELLMAPYAVAHMKLGLLLQELGYKMNSDQRLGVYLTNTLEEATQTSEALFAQFISEEANEAARVKRDEPIMVVLGNPPYSGSSANRGEHIDQLMERYKSAVKDEYNIGPLSDDYIKFIRFAHDRIEKTGYGVISLITNNSYLSGLVHRGMREELLKSFDDIYILNLHGSTIMGLTSPDGIQDQNVFDIRQGVAITLLIKRAEGKGSNSIRYAELWGSRRDKYQFLLEHDLKTTSWDVINMTAPFYFFVPKNMDMWDEYQEFPNITEVFGIYQRGVATRRDHFMVDYEITELENRLTKLASNSSNSEITTLYNINSTKYWSLDDARKLIKSIEAPSEKIYPYSYRPFDTRYVIYIPEIIERGDAATQIMYHMKSDNIALLGFRRIRDDANPFFVGTGLIDKTILSSKDNATVFPLYVYPEKREGELFGVADDGSAWPLSAKGRRPNLNPAFVKDMADRLGLDFVPEASAPPHARPETDSQLPHPRPETDSQLPHARPETDSQLPHPQPLPASQGGEKSPSPHSGEGFREGIYAHTRISAEIWEKLKPLARDMRKNPTPAEDQLWQRLRRKQVHGFKFRRQHPVGHFIADFYCAEARLVVEVDGPVHENQEEYDQLRQAYIESLGLRVLRFTNGEVIQQIDGVVERIGEALQAPQPESDSQPPHPRPETDSQLPHPRSETDSQLPHARPETDSQLPHPRPLSHRDASQGGESESPSPHSGVPQAGSAQGFREGIFTPEDIFAYAYAVFHSPTYRERYAEFLKIDFPRLPLTSDVALFRVLVEKGAALVDLHLMRSPLLGQLVTAYPVAGDDVVAKSGGYPKFVPHPNGRVYINKTQYFDGVPEAVWHFQVGGYQVLEKWLKDRRGRTLSYEDIRHYQRVVVALRETMRLMDEIDAAIPGWPLK